MRSFLLLLALSTPVLADSMTDVMARIDKAAGNFKALTATVKQTVYTALVHDKTVATGSIKFKRPKPDDTRILLELAPPQQKIVSIEGDTATIFYPKAKTAQKFNLRDKRDILQQLLALGFGNTSAALKSSFDVTYVGQEQINGQPADHLKLIPRSKEVQQQLKQADLWISEAQGVSVQQRFTTSGSGDYTETMYSDIRLNPSLSDKDLRIDIPKGVQIQKVGSSQ